MTEPSLNLRSAVRALLLDDRDELLLARYVFESGIVVWALPGGGLDPDESDEDGLRRELYEELGLADVTIGPHVWNRTHVIPMYTGHDGQTDRVYVVRTHRFEPEPVIGWERLRAEFVQELRWWTLPEIEAATDVRFAPRRLAALLGDLLREGPPADGPVDTGV